MKLGKVRIVYMALEKILCAEKNPKEHATEELKASVRRFGFIEPLTMNEATGRLVAGHGRLEALQQMRAAGDAPPVNVLEAATDWTVPVVRGVSFSDEREAQAYLLASNQLTIRGGWNNRDLADVLQSIAGAMEPSEMFGRAALASLEGVGFGVADLAKVFPGRKKRPRVDPDDVPLLPRAEPRTKTGDRIVLGDHVLVCGDSRDPATWERLMGGEKAQLVVTDPPYGVNYVSSTTGLPVHNDDPEGLEALLCASLANVLEATIVGTPWYVFGPAGPNAETFLRVLRELRVGRQTLVWEKDQLVMGRSDFHYQHEMIFYGWSPLEPLLVVEPRVFDGQHEYVLYGWTPGGPHRGPNDRKQTSVWKFDRPKKSEEHPTKKPVEMVEHAISISSDVGAVVIDAFAGSGTTLVAAELQGRRARVVEFSPRYCDAIVARWQAITGRLADYSAG